jgi:hypothetical protein
VPDFRKILNRNCLGNSSIVHRARVTETLQEGKRAETVRQAGRTRQSVAGLTSGFPPPEEQQP